MNTIDICNELHQNAIDFAYEANSQRAFADARDGLKPGQRACLWEMFSKGYASTKPHVKSAKISGGTIASWWPHGDVAIYETFGRMSQPWINNIPEVDWHGANGNQIIGPALASARYTEARLSKASEDGLFQGIKKKNVPMILNFSEDEEWPEVLPAIMPRLLLNGCQGIGYTLANHWVPFNLKEVSEVIIDYINNNELNYNNLYPDFPSGGIIINKNEINEIHKTGRGKVVLRGKTEIKNNNILITELPYQVYVEPLIDSIKDLIDKEEIKGIKDIYNKSDKKRLLIEIECDGSAAVVLNQLLKSTDLQKSYNPNQYALVGKTPKLLNLKDYLDIYINHNLLCIQKESEFDLEKAQARLEIVNGLLKALEDIDNIIKLIKESKSSADARVRLEQKYGFTESQSKAIVDMRLGKLANLEKIELNQEKTDLDKTVIDCLEIINNINKRKSIFVERLSDFTKKYGINRKTEVIQISSATKEEKEIEFVEPEKCVVVMTKGGLIKRVPASAFKSQKRNGKGVKTQDDITSAVIRTNTIDSLMVFSTKGKMYRLLVNDIPVGNNTTKGISVKTIIEMEPDEQPTIIYSIYRDTEAKYIVFITKNGLIKKTTLEEYVQTKKKNGIIALNIKDDDELVSAFLVKDEPIIILTKNGYCIKFNSLEVGATGRATSGVKAINLTDGDCVAMGLALRNSNDELAIFSGNGLGKKIKQEELIPQKRGGRGVICYKTSSMTGDVIAGVLVEDEDNVLIVGETKSICISAKEIPSLSRAATGNQMIKNGKVKSVSKV